jgi:hypothetical protein
MWQATIFGKYINIHNGYISEAKWSPQRSKWNVPLSMQRRYGQHFLRFAVSISLQTHPGPVSGIWPASSPLIDARLAAEASLYLPAHHLESFPGLT